MLFRFILFATFTLLFGQLSLAQVSGTVKDAATDEPLAGAVVGALSLPDSVVVDAAIADGDGAFVLKSIKAEAFTGVITVSCLGYESREYSVQARVDAALTAQSTELQEVTVTASSLRVEAGKFVFTPGRISQAVFSAWDILAYTPFLSIRDNVLKMPGKENIIIRINGREPDLPQDAVVQLLQNFPPEQIARIEVITNAGSGYDITTGIINVVLKREFDGFYLNAKANGRYRNEHLGAGGSILAYTSIDKLRASVYGGYDYSNTFEKTVNSYLFHSDHSSRQEVSASHTRWKHYFGALSLSYQANQLDCIGMKLNLSGLNYTSSQSTTATNFNAVSAPVSAHTTYSEQLRPFTDPRLFVSAFWIHSLGNSPSSIEVQVNASTMKMPGSNSYFEDNVLTAEESIADRFQSLNGFIELEKYFTRSILRTGYKFYGGKYKIRNKLTSGDDFFNYTDIDNILYADYIHIFSQTFNMSVGAKGQFFHTFGSQQVNDSHFSNTSFELIPNINLSFNLPHDQSLSIDYSHRVRKPMYEYLNPRVVQLSDDSYSCGNPNLKNEISYKFYLNYAFLKRFTFSASYSISHNEFAQLRTLDQNNIIRYSYSNYGHSRSYTFDLRYKQPLFSDRLLLCGQLFCSLDRYSFAPEYSYFNSKCNYFNWNADIYWTISKQYGWSTSLSFNPAHNSDFQRESVHSPAMLSFTLSKSFDFGAEIELYCSTYLSKSYRTYLNSDVYDFNFRRCGNSTFVDLSFSYTLFKGKPKRVIDRSSNDASSRFELP